MNAQERIDAISWYHEFDFGNGLKAVAKSADIDDHRAIWRFIETELDRIDFRNKTVLDIGCWDGFWSFYAERRGAKSVLASDDSTQNWSQSSGLLLARELLGSGVEVDANRSIYDLRGLGRRFDIILCLGVYYHLVDPFYAFAEIRHCCHRDTLVVLEGDATLGLRSNAMLYDLSDHAAAAIYVPTPYSLEHMLRGAYFAVVSKSWATEPKPASWRRRIRMAFEGIANAPASRPGYMGRLLTVCKPFEGSNPMHIYRPPFGLHAYDERFRGREAQRSPHHPPLDHLARA